jgi:hypothetical protein
VGRTRLWLNNLFWPEKLFDIELCSTMHFFTFNRYTNLIFYLFLFIYISILAQGMLSLIQKVMVFLSFVTLLNL